MSRSLVQETRQAGPRPVSRPHDRDEREARRAAEVVAGGGSAAGWSFSSVSPSGPVQRQEVVKEKTEEEKQKEAISKTLEAVQETPQAKAVKEKILEEPRVKAVKEAATSTPGLIVGGAALVGGVAALGAAKRPLPFQLPEFPLDKVTPGLSGQVKLEGPVNSPTFVGLTLTYKEQGPKGKKTAESDKIAADIARLKREREMFKPQSQKQAEKKQEQELLDAWIKSQSGRLPGLTVPLQGKPKAEEEPKKKEEEQTLVQPAQASPSAAMPAAADVDDALATPGRPLDPATRRSMEARFGHDFSGVRVHDDARAGATAGNINAAAFTVGQDIVFGPGRYAPSTARGRELLAHELAHTIQQRGSRSKAPPTPPGSALEVTAETAGRDAANGRPVPQSLGRSGVAVAREVIGNETMWVPEQLRDWEVEEFHRLWSILTSRGEYSGRERDLQRFEVLKALAKVRIDERKSAVGEAEAIGTRVDKPEVEEPEPTSMALPAAKDVRKPAKPRPKLEPKRRATAPSKFEPGGFTDEDIKRLESEGSADVGRAVKEAEQAAEERRREFEESWGDPIVWGYVPNEYGGSDRVQMRRSELEAAQDRAKNRPILATMEGISGAGPIATAGMVVGGTARVIRGGESKAAVPSALALGGPLDVFAASVAPAFGASPVEAEGRSQFGDPTGSWRYRPRPPGLEPSLVPRPRATPTQPSAVPAPTSGAPGGGEPPAPLGPVEVTPDEVRAIYQENPYAVKKSLTTARHQANWREHGGTDDPANPAPLAYRHPGGRTIVVDEARWPSVGKLEEINQPYELGPPRGEAALRAEAAAKHPWGTVKTLVDPKGKTMPDPGGIEARTKAPAGQPAGEPTPASMLPEPAPGRAPPAPVPLEEVAAAHRADPSSVLKSWQPWWHEFMWAGVGGKGVPPRAFRVGKVIVVHPDLPL